MLIIVMVMAKSREWVGIVVVGSGVGWVMVMEMIMDSFIG